MRVANHCINYFKKVINFSLSSRLDLTDCQLAIATHFNNIRIQQYNYKIVVIYTRFFLGTGLYHSAEVEKDSLDRD